MAIVTLSNSEMKPLVQKLLGGNTPKPGQVDSFNKALAKLPSQLEYDTFVAAANKINIGNKPTGGDTWFWYSEVKTGLGAAEQAAANEYQTSTGATADQTSIKVIDPINQAIATTDLNAIPTINSALKFPEISADIKHYLQIQDDKAIDDLDSSLKNMTPSAQIKLHEKLKAASKNGATPVSDVQLDAALTDVTKGHQPAIPNQIQGIRNAVREQDIADMAKMLGAKLDDFRKPLKDFSYGAARAAREALDKAPKDDNGVILPAARDNAIHAAQEAVSETHAEFSVSPDATGYTATTNPVGARPDNTAFAQAVAISNKHRLAAPDPAPTAPGASASASAALPPASAHVARPPAAAHVATPAAAHVASPPAAGTAEIKPVSAHPRRQPHHTGRTANHHARGAGRNSGRSHAPLNGRMNPNDRPTTEQLNEWSLARARVDSAEMIRADRAQAAAGKPVNLHPGQSAASAAKAPHFAGISTSPGPGSGGLY